MHRFVLDNNNGGRNVKICIQHFLGNTLKNHCTPLPFSLEWQGDRIFVTYSECHLSNLFK